MAATVGWWMHARERQTRALLLAVLVSLAAHMLLLLAFPETSESRKRMIFPPPLVARLVPIEPPAPSQAPLPRFEPLPIPAPRAARPTPNAIAKTAPKPELPRTEPVPASNAPTSEKAQAPQAAPAKPVAPAATAKAEPRSSAPPPSERTDLGTLEEYQKAIRIAAARYKRYPRVAVENNWEGSVVVRMSIGSGGALSELGVKASTGHEILDKEALDMVRKAISLVPIPGTLRGKEFTTDIRVIFSLRDEG